MNTTQPISSIGALRARRAFGAMIFTFFGAVLLGIWGRRVGASAAIVVAIAVLGIVLLASAYRRYRRFAPILAMEPDTPAKKRADRIFNIVNAGQWVVILVLGNVLANMGLGDWVVPMGIFVIGLHFLPLAYAFRNTAHYFLGTALVGFAIAYPQVASGGPADPVGFLGTGLILWLGALWALRGPVPLHA
jgi:hypothetical protein